MGPLGRRVPTDYEHVQRFALPEPTKDNLPVVFASMWLDSMDEPVKGRDGRWRICQSTDWMKAPSRGGHAYCLEPAHGNDAWWPKHDQHRGSCTGHSIARAAELIYRLGMDSETWYDLNQLGDEWPDTPPEEGSSARAAFDVWRTQGAVVKGKPDPKRKIRSNRWITSAGDLAATLGHPGEEVPILQSWGRSWPHRVWVGLEVLEWHLARDGEAGVPLR